MFEVNGMVEKPPQGSAPSNLSITGALHSATRKFSRSWRPSERGAGGEDPFHRCDDRPFKDPKVSHGVEFEGERHDCGSKAGFLRANIAFGLTRPELRELACARS